MVESCLSLPLLIKWMQKGGEKQMADSFKSFPCNKQEALALEYVRSQDLSDKTPEEIAAMYDDAYFRINDALKVLYRERHEPRI